MSNVGYSPTPEEIRRVCLQIQAEWSERERQGRIANYRERSSPWVVPVVSDAKDVALV